MLYYTPNAKSLCVVLRTGRQASRPGLHVPVRNKRTCTSRRCRSVSISCLATNPFGRDLSGMEETDEILQGEVTSLEEGVAPVTVHSSPQVVNAVKKNDWALRSVLKGEHLCRGHAWACHVTAAVL